MKIEIIDDTPEEDRELRAVILNAIDGKPARSVLNVLVSVLVFAAEQSDNLDDIEGAVRMAVAHRQGANQG